MRILILFCSFFILGLGFFTLLKKPDAGLNRRFFLTTVATFVWLTTYTLANILNIPLDHKIQILRIGYCGVTFIGITYLSFSIYSLLQKRSSRIDYFNYLLGVITSILFLKTDLLFNGTNSYSWGIYPKAGPLHPFFLVYFSTCIALSWWYLLKGLKKEGSIHQKYWGFSYIIFSLASIDFVPNYGIDIYPFGFIFATIFCLLVTYGIIRYQLFDIQIIIRRSIVYSLLITTISTIYLVAVILFEKLFQTRLGYTTFPASIFATTLIAIIFNPLRNRIQFIIERSVFRSTSYEAIEENQHLREQVAQTEKLRSVATLASGLVHEIRNPLTTINTFAEYLPQKRNDPEFLEKCRKVLRSETSRVNELLTELLAFAKPSNPEFQNVSLHDIIEDVLLLIKPKCGKQNIRVEKSLSLHPPLQADPNQLKQAILNIILNAIEAMPDGGVLTILTHQNDKHQTLSISDTGQGIDPKDIKQIFDPFFTRKTKGNGLGLAVTYGIIEKHRGKIEVKSEMTKGTTFNIHLPYEI